MGRFENLALSKSCLLLEANDIISRIIGNKDRQKRDTVYNFLTTRDGFQLGCNCVNRECKYFSPEINFCPCKLKDFKCNGIYVYYTNPRTGQTIGERENTRGITFSQPRQHRRSCAECGCSCNNCFCLGEEGCSDCGCNNVDECGNCGCHCESCPCGFERCSECRCEA
jgi:hypothetical protein